MGRPGAQGCLSEGCLIEDRPIEDRPTYFIDRCLETPMLSAALKAAGVGVRLYSHVYPGRDAQAEVSDAFWIRRCGKEGWVGLTKDLRSLKSVPVRQEVRRHGVILFQLASRQLNMASECEAILHALPKIESTVDEFQGKALMARFYKPGSSPAIRIVHEWT